MKVTIDSPRIPPWIACLLHYVIVGMASVMLHDLIITVEDTHRKTTATTTSLGIAIFLAVYALYLLLFRLLMASSKVAIMSKSSSTAKLPTTTTNNNNNHVVVYKTHDPTAIVWYEFTWLCNVTLVMSAVALATHRLALAWAYASTVAIDQVLWYVDGMSYIATRRTIVGVFRHIFVQPTTMRWYHHLTTWHHVWTLPLLVWATVSVHAAQTAQQHQPTTTSTFAMHQLLFHDDQVSKIFWQHYYPTWLLSSMLMTVNVLLSRVLTPYGLVICIPSTARDKSSFFHYLNVNLSYEVWKDLSKSIAYLRIQDDNPSVPVYLLRLLVRWGLLNSLLWAIAVAAAFCMFGIKKY